MISIRVLTFASLLALVACGPELSTTTEESRSSDELALASSPLRLQYFSSIVQHDYYWDQLIVQLDVRVNDAACGSVVVVHLTENDADWSDLPATRLASAGAGFSLYRATLSHPGSKGVRFALRCNDGAAAKWDNNGGADYRFAGQTGWVLTTGNIYNAGYTPHLQGQPGTLSGSVALRNLAYAKRVTVVFSTDGWRTTQTAAAKFRTLFYTPGLTNPNALGNEAWDFSLPVGDAGRVDYAIAYEVSGQTFWDNNFGQNYSALR